MKSFVYFVIFIFCHLSTAEAKISVCLKDVLNTEIEINRWVNNSGVLIKEQGAKSFTTIDNTNFDEIFKHQYIHHELPDVKGAKSLVYKTTQNEQIVIFWKTGDNETANNIHHRDALASILKKEYDANTETYIKMHGQEDVSDVLKSAEESENDLFVLASNRQHNTLVPELLKRSQGFQFTSHKGKIIHIDLDSSITHAQLENNTLVKEDVLESLLKNIDAIDKSLLNLSSIRIVGNFNDARLVELKTYLYNELAKRNLNEFFWSKKIKIKIITRDEKPEFSLH